MSALTEALGPLLTAEVRYSAGDAVFHQADPVEHLYVVRSGCVHLVRWGIDGASAVMQRAIADSVLAESSIFTTAYHCDALCVEDSLLSRADANHVRQTIETQPELHGELTRHLAREVMRMRARVELLARRTVAERLDGWFALNGGALPSKGAWRSVAEDIGVSPEAFYRELQRRRANGKA